jgi:hypothetical protein
MHGINIFTTALSILFLNSLPYLSLVVLIDLALDSGFFLFFVGVL